MRSRNTVFDLGGINHLALVCSDMERTVHFYRDILGMPLLKTIDLPESMGQHFFFDAGNGDCIAFFWFPDNPEAVPGVTNAESCPGAGEWGSAISSMNHVAFTVPLEKFDEYRKILKGKGVAVGPVLNHDESPSQVAPTMRPGVYVRSFYFQDPDGILLEFASWTREFTASDVVHEPKRRSDRRMSRDEPAGV